MIISSKMLKGKRNMGMRSIGDIMYSKAPIMVSFLEKGTRESLRYSMKSCKVERWAVSFSVEPLRLIRPLNSPFILPFSVEAVPGSFGLVRSILVLQ